MSEALIQEVYIERDWARGGHWVVIIGRAYPGAPRAWLKASGEWEPTHKMPVAPPPSGGQEVGLRFPEGALDALVAAYAKTAAPHPATERHLTDAMGVRDRLLAMLENQ